MKRFRGSMAPVLPFVVIAVLTSGLTVDRASAADVTFQQAVNVVLAAQARANAINVPMDIAIVDRGGRLTVFARMDGTWIGSIDIAQAKAFTATAFCNDNAPLRPALIRCSCSRSCGQAGHCTACRAPTARMGSWPFPVV